VTVQVPLAPPPIPAPETGAGVIEGADAGVIEDARARQRRQRATGLALLLIAVVAGVLIATGGGGGGGGRQAGRQPSGSGNGAGPAHASASTSFPGAPETQKNGYGVSSGVCPLAPPNRYLPPRSGCVTVWHADVNGDGRPDLVIAYSQLSRRKLDWPSGTPLGFRHDFSAKAAFLKVVLAGGGSVTTHIVGGNEIRNGSRTPAKAASIDSVAHVNADPGDEIFLEVGRISSGATGVAYGFDDGRLIPAGVYLSYNGDSGVEAGFNCVPGNPPRLIQRYFSFVGPNELTRSWRETEVVYAWQGPKLTQVSKQTFKQLVALKFKPLDSLKSSETQIGTGCIRGVS
jgi:hypothetical protein